jgi:regulatory protein
MESISFSKPIDQSKNNLDKKQPKVLNYFMYLVSKRDYTTQELIDKAMKRGHSGAETKVALSFLKDSNYINDKRFVEATLENYKGQKGYFWIVQKLRRRKVPESIIELSLEEVDFYPSDEFKRKVFNKYKIDSLTAIDMKLKMKIANYISRQGFNDVFRILREWETENS